MHIQPLSAAPDLVARRVRLAWTLQPQAGETLADAPRQVLRRKTRDFEFPSPLPAPDPYLVYDSASFPPVPAPGLMVTELPLREDRADGLLTVTETTSVADDVGGRPLERLRRTLRTVYDADGQALQRQVEIIDSGSTPLSLEPGTACYYQLSSPVFTPLELAAQRAIATPGTPHGLNRTLYEMLPAVHRQFDVALRPATPGSDSIPEMAGRSGQMRRLLDVYGAVLDAARSSAEGLRTLHDIDRVDGRRLPLLAQWLGWRLGDADALPLARNELKATPRLYETVGTVTALRALVTRYTGWDTRVAEFVQHLVRSNDAVQPPLRVAMQAGTGWRSPLDAAALLGFGTGNDEAFGAGALPATLTGAVEPFALFDGAELSLAVDGGPAWRVRFGSGDFTSLGAASAAEVAAAVNGVAAAAGALQASVAAGRLLLTSRSTGSEAQLNVVGRDSEPLTLDSSAADRPAAVLDALGRLRVFASPSAPTPDPQRRDDEHCAAASLLCKTWMGGRWRGSQRLPATRALAQAAAGSASAAAGPTAPGTATPQPVRTAGALVQDLVAHPATAVLPDGRLLLAWVDAPHGAAASLRWCWARSRTAEPARLQGRLGPRFVLQAGAQLTLQTASGPDVFVVNAADYANPAQASSAEIVLAMNAQFIQLQASAAPDGTLRLVSNASGPQAWLAVDLALSTCARVLGLAHGNTRTAGRWDDTLDCDTALPWPFRGPAPLRPTELTAVAQGEGARLAWADFAQGRWQLQGACTLGPFELAATANGLALRRDDGVVTVLTTVDGLPSNRVRHALVDADGALWVATDAGTARRRANGSWALIDAAAGLPSDDTRQLVQAGNGDLWVATAAGLGRIQPSGAASGLTLVDGLPSNDVRALAHDGAGGLWLATAAGLSRRDGNGVFVNVGAPDLPSLDVREVATSTDGGVYAATSAGLVQRGPGGQWSLLQLPAAAGLDVRAVAVDQQALWVGAASGAWRRSNDGRWLPFGTAQGLPSADVRRLLLDAAGSAWLATPAGAVRITVHGNGSGGAAAATPTAASVTIHLWQLAQGLPSNDVAALGSAWSSAVAVSDGGLVGNHRADRTPSLLREASGTLLLLWSRWLAGAAGEDRRALRVRRFDPATHSWGAVADVTQPLAAGSADTQPAALAGPLPGAGARVFFSSDRAGGVGLWELPLSAALVPGLPLALPGNEEARTAPLPVAMPGASTLLLFRSDGNTASDQLAPVLAGGAPPQRSLRVPEAATLRRHAGSTSVRRADLARNSQHLQWGDLLSCTPHRPLGRSSEPPLSPAEFYTRGTLGLYVTRGRFGQPLTSDNAARLRQLLAEFLPINLRAVIVLAPALAIELIYGPGADLADSYSDSYPFVDALGAPVDSWAAALPAWAVLLSNDLVSLSADPSNLVTLRRRSHFPPLQ